MIRACPACRAGAPDDSLCRCDVEICADHGTPLNDCGCDEPPDFDGPASEIAAKERARAYLGEG